VLGTSWGGTAFPVGTHLLFSGFNPGPFRLTFTNAVSSIQLDAQANFTIGQTVTLKAYDSSDGLVGSDTAPTSASVAATLSVTSPSNNIKYFTVEASNNDGVGFTNIVWGCAA
jgi:hypothetical protein